MRLYWCVWSAEGRGTGRASTFLLGVVLIDPRPMAATIDPERHTEPVGWKCQVQGAAEARGSDRWPGVWRTARAFPGPLAGPHSREYYGRPVTLGSRRYVTASPGSW